MENISLERMRENLTKRDPLNDWLEEAIKTDSQNTKHNWKREINKFAEWLQLDPRQLYEDYRKTENKQEFLEALAGSIKQYYLKQIKPEYAPLTRQKILAILRSFFRSNSIPVDPKIQDRYFVTNHNRQIKKEEIRRILQHSSLHEKTFYLMMLETGLRPNTIVQLQYRHIKEDFEKERVPMRIVVPAKLLKDRVGKRYSFIGQDAYDSLREYLIARLPLQDNNYLFVSKRMKGDHLGAANFSESFGRIVDKLELCPKEREGKLRKLRLYCLRKYFRNNADTPEPAFWKYWGGWTLKTDAHYFGSDVEKHRSVYAKGYESLRVLRETGALKEVKMLRGRVNDLEKERDLWIKEAFRQEEDFKRERFETEKRMKKLEDQLEKLQKKVG